MAWAKASLVYDVASRIVEYHDLPFARPDPAALPVRRTLSADPDEGVSDWAKRAIGEIILGAVKDADCP